jgi:hypothetical protein
MFTTKLILFSIRTITVPTHTKSISKLMYIPNFSIIESVPKQLIEPMLSILYVNLTIPLDTIKQHLPKIFFHLEVKEMIIG